MADAEETQTNIEKENQQREIELANLQQEIIKMENEKSEIGKKLLEIVSKIHVPYYSNLASDRYPVEFKKFQQYRNQVKNCLNDSNSISNIKLRFSQVSEELQIYKEALIAYESFYQKYEEIRSGFIKKEQKDEPVQVGEYQFKDELVRQIINSFDPSEMQYIFLPDLKKRLNEMSVEELQIY